VIVEAVAAAEDAAVTEVEPLYRTADPEAIDRLFDGDADTPGSPERLQLSLGGWNVFLRGDGAICVCDPENRSEPASPFEKPLAD